MRTKIYASNLTLPEALGAHEYKRLHAIRKYHDNLPMARCRIVSALAIERPSQDLFACIVCQMEI